jgi:hypothetical protein
VIESILLSFEQLNLEQVIIKSVEAGDTDLRQIAGFMSVRATWTCYSANLLGLLTASQLPMET